MLIPVEFCTLRSIYGESVTSAVRRPFSGWQMKTATVLAVFWPAYASGRQNKTVEVLSDASTFPPPYLNESAELLPYWLRRLGWAGWSCLSTSLLYLILIHLDRLNIWPLCCSLCRPLNGQESERRNRMCFWVCLDVYWGSGYSIWRIIHCLNRNLLK